MIDCMAGNPMDTTKIATLVRHWIEHNRGHRESYDEWRAKLAHAGLPITVAALEKVAALTDQANRALGEALVELQGAAVDLESGGAPASPATTPADPAATHAEPADATAEPHTHTHHHGGGAG